MLLPLNTRACRSIPTHTLMLDANHGQSSIFGFRFQTFNYSFRYLPITTMSTSAAAETSSSTAYPLMVDDDSAAIGSLVPPQDSLASAPDKTQEISTAGHGSNHTNADTFTPTPMIPHLAAATAGVQIDYYGLALVFLAPALGGFLYGYDIGATSFGLAMLRSSRDPDTWWHDFSMMKQGILVSALSLGALLGSHVVLVYLAKSIGRRKEIRIAASLFIVGAMLNVMSGTIFATTQVGRFGLGIGIVTLISGRLLYGAGVGFIMHGAPTYMAEMSPSKVRGAVVSAKETVIVFGIVVGMLMGDLMSDYPDNWSDLYAFEILGAVSMLFLTFKIPRSKRWLLMKGYREEAKESMQFVYKGNVEDEFERMAETIGSLCCRNDANDGEDDDFSATGSVCSSSQDFAGGLNYKGETRIRHHHKRDISLIDEMPVDDASLTQDGSCSTRSESLDEEGHPRLTARKYRPIMVIGLTLLVAQQASGQPSVLAYSRVLFEAAGWKGHASVITVLIMGLTSGMTVSVVDRLGRKVLLMSGCVIMCLALLSLALGFWGWEHEGANGKNELSNWQQNLVLWSMFVYIAGYQVGYGPITWTLLSEIYPSEIRGTAMALSVEVNFFFKFLTQLLFPLVQEHLGWGCTFIVFACLLVVSFLFILLKVPETRGMTLEEIQWQLRGLRQPSRIQKVEKPLSSPLLQSRGDDESPALATKQHGLTPIV